MIIRIDHVSIAVKDLAKAKALFIDALGGKELYSAPLEDQGFRWTTVELGSSCFIELIDRVGNEGFLHRFLDERGEGMHHITIQVEDAREAQKNLEDRGVPTFGYSEAIPGWKEFFVHPKHAFGALLQFAEFNPLDWINPGYVPRSYHDFVEKRPARIEVREREDAAEPAVELSDGTSSLHVGKKDLPDLIRRLEEAAR